MTEQRKALLKASAVAIIVYAVVVVVYTNMTPYLGIRFFVQRVQSLSVEPADKSMDRPMPRRGDLLVEIAGQPVRSNESPLATIVNTIANLWNEAKFPAPTISSVADLPKLTDSVVEIDGRRAVRLRFQSPPDDPLARGTFDRWFWVEEPPLSRSLLSIAWLVMESVVFWLGWLVFRRRPEDNSAALFFLMCIVTVGAYMGWYHWLEISSSPPLVFVFAVCAMAVPPVSLHFHLLVPTPKRFMLLRPRWTLALLYGLPAVIQIGILWSVSRLFHTFRHQQPEAGAWWERILGGLLWIYIAVGAAMFVGCVWSLWQSYRVPRHPSHRDQVRWLLRGSILAGLFIGYTLYLAISDRASFLVGDATWAMFLASFAFVASYSISILRYQLLSIEEIVASRGWTYLTIRLAGAIAFYVVVGIVIGVTPRLFSGIPQPTGYLIAICVVLTLYVVHTIRTWLGAMMDRWFYRERNQLDWAMRRLGEAVDNLAEPSTVRRHILVVAANCVNARQACVYQRIPRNGYLRTEVSGETPFPERLDADHPIIEKLKGGELLQKTPHSLIREDDDSQVLRSIHAELAQPLIHDGKLIGIIVVGPRAEGMYNSAELAFLRGLGDLATIALHNAQSQQTLEKINDDLRNRMTRVPVLPVAVGTEANAEPVRDVPTAQPLNYIENLHGSGPALNQILDVVRKVAVSTATVLIRGESGTGKTMLAEVIHRNSPRSHGPFVKVHCAALSPSLLESELFGHVKGAYTGAIRDKVGRFQLADGGTLFLDEIGDISLDTQTKLLRVLQEMTFEPVGSSESIRVDVRIVAATHQPLEELIRKGRLREDLYYRLNVISIRMPALRERREDIRELARFFVNRFREQSGKVVESIDGEALAMLEDHAWPGNIRELQNVMEHAVVMAHGPSITVDDLPAELCQSSMKADLEPAIRTNGTSRPSVANGSLVVELDDIEKQRLLGALEAGGGNKSKAARILGIPRSTLCSKLKKYHLD